MSKKQHMFAIAPKDIAIPELRALFDNEVRAWEYLLRYSLEEFFEVIAFDIEVGAEQP